MDLKEKGPAMPENDLGGPGRRQQRPMVPEAGARHSIAGRGCGPAGLDAAIGDVRVELRAVLGRRVLRVRDVLRLGRGALVELDRSIEDTIEIWIGTRCVARGEIEIVDGRVAVRITETVSADRA